jgi:hypothetical protein
MCTTKNAYTCRRRMSYAWMKSQAHVASAWFARKVAPLCPPLLDRTPFMYFWMVQLLTWRSSLSSSPRIRSAPQNRLRLGLLRMRPISSGARPEAFRGLDLCRQYRRKPVRCHLRMVSGWTTTMAFRDAGNKAASMSSRSLSVSPRRGRPLVRRSTLTWRRRVTFSTKRARRERRQRWATTWIGSTRS